MKLFKPVLKHWSYLADFIVIVLGIVVALSLDNWNENRKKSKSESVYYCRILEDFELDKEIISELYENAENRIKISKNLLLDLHSQTLEKNYLLNTYLQTIIMDVFVPRKMAFEDLISSGNLKLLSDISLKNSLIKYYSELENILKQLNQNRDEIIKRAFNYEYITEFGYQEFDYLNKSLGSEIIKLLPNENWTNNKNNKYFKKFQDDIVFIVTMNERQKQHLDRIKDEMKIPYELLENKCDINIIIQNLKTHI